jgi:hypothetical protein
MKTFIVKVEETPVYSLLEQNFLMNSYSTSIYFFQSPTQC